MAFAPGFFGYNFVAWLCISIARFVTEWVHAWIKKLLPSRDGKIQHLHITPRDVAVIMAARNEEKALPETLRALIRNLPAANIFIGSDGSTDATVHIAKQYGCHVIDIQPNRGKSRVLSYLIRRFNILKKFRAVLIMDAEVIVSDDYLRTILPYFNDSRVVAFVSHSISYWEEHWVPRWSMFFTAYRVRLWFLLYYALRFGQTWKYTCATPIIPGGSSVYRSTALKQIEIDTPGLVIEDFHMTFQVYHKRLGLIASHPSAYIIDQEPYSMRDYIRQVYRWFLGFWQTVFYHGYWPSFFWFTNALFVLEMLLSSIIIVAVPLIVFIMILDPYQRFALLHITIVPLEVTYVPVTVVSLIVSVLVLDYVVTCAVAMIQKKPMMLIYGLGFFILRYIDTCIFLWTLPRSLFARTVTGSWTHPKRR